MRRCHSSYTRYFPFPGGLNRLACEPQGWAGLSLYFLSTGTASMYCYTLLRRVLKVGSGDQI